MSDPEPHRLPADSDVDLHEPRQRAELGHPAVLASISLGGALGAAARYGLGVAFPTAPRAFPWTIFTVNVVGCLLIGVLMVLVTHVFRRRALLRPFLGVGVLGGFTTFSAYVEQIRQLLAVGAAPIAAAYLVGTVLAAVPACWAGLAATRRVLRLAGRPGVAPEANA